VCYCEDSVEPSVGLAGEFLDFYRIHGTPSGHLAAPAVQLLTHSLEMQSKHFTFNMSFWFLGLHYLEERSFSGTVANITGATWDQPKILTKSGELGEVHVQILWSVQPDMLIM
jgi:hypothetical protein